MLPGLEVWVPALLAGAFALFGAAIWQLSRGLSFAIDVIDIYGARIASLSAMQREGNGHGSYQDRREAHNDERARQDDGRQDHAQEERRYAHHQAGAGEKEVAARSGL